MNATRAIGPLAAEGPPPVQDERFRAHRAVRSVLELLAADHRLVVELDDLHWADDASVELILHLLRRPPKALPRQTFGDDFAAQAVQQARQHGGGLHDLLCTATHFVARGITNAVGRFVPRGFARVFVSGGGARNGLLWHLLEQHLGGPSLAHTDAAGVPAGLREPMAFALLAALTVDGVPGNAPSATGAAASRLLGSVTPGSSSNWSRCLGWMAAQAPPLAAHV